MPENTKPVIVFPIHDPVGLVLPHLETIIPDLKSLFSCALVQVSKPTQVGYPQKIRNLETDGFFRFDGLLPDLPVGDQFKSLYLRACSLFGPDKILHLCFPDRATYALLSEHRQAFIRDMQKDYTTLVPMLFHRSEIAWNTHPRNYFSAEMMVTELGQKLFRRSLDFAWCHMVISVRQLAAILPQVHAHGLEMVAEMVLPILDIFQVQEVDWLAWEDPFIYGRNADELKLEREQSPQETQKRLNYVIPMLKLLEDWSIGQGNGRS